MSTSCTYLGVRLFSAKIHRDGAQAVISLEPGGAEMRSEVEEMKYLVEYGGREFVAK